MPTPRLPESAPPDYQPEPLELFDALSPLVTDILGGADFAADEGDDPFQSLIADIAIQKSREPSTSQGDGRRALLRAVAELAETHAVAADLACERTAIDLPLDAPRGARADVADSAGSADSADDDLAVPSVLVVPDMVRACRDRLAGHASPSDRMKIDAVATLFDHVLGDERLPTATRNTLARLQLPVLRMALADDAFFESAAHPTRRLLDRLVESAADSRTDTAGSHTAGTALERVVHTVIRGSYEDAREHARLLEEFERAIIDIAKDASGAPIEAPLGREDRDVLVIKATIQISQLLAGIEVDRAIRDFLLDVWSLVLIEVACRPPTEAREALLARIKRLCFDLAWTAAPKTTSGERARLAGVLPTMIAAIRDGLRIIDYPKADEDRFFAKWTRVLLQAVRGAPGAPSRSDRSDGAEDGIDAFARHLREGSFGPEPPQHGGAGDGLASAMAYAPGIDGHEDGAPISIASLRKGDWFELRGPRGFTRVRLSWVSPLRSFYLFIGADSALTRSLDPEALAALIEGGDLRRPMR